MSPLSWFGDRTPKWFTIRDSYFVATDGPEAVSLPLCLLDVTIDTATKLTSRPNSTKSSC
jgi:hypothetical protein